MQHAKTPLIGRLAVQFKLITLDQLNEATAEQGRSGGDKRLGEIFLELGFLSDKQLAKLESIQQDLIAKHRAKQQAGAAPGAVQGVAPARSREQVLQQAARAAQDASPVTSAAVQEIAAAPTPPAEPRPVPRPAAPAATGGAAATAQAVAPPPDGAERAPAEQAPALQPAAGDESTPSLELLLPGCDQTDQGRLAQILGAAVQAGASDVHLHSGERLKMRLNGELHAQGGDAMARESVERLVSAALTPAQRAELCHDGELDFCFDVPGVGRFRANAYRQQRGFDVVFRSIPSEPPTLADLGLPHELARFVNYHQGMVLVTGPAGCGKSATLAALVNLINEEREEHILTVEDPIEVIHPSKRCLVNQRHAGRHTASFARALRGALREDPDVIVIGELRDLETISLAMTAAETGHFVLATLHTNNAVRTINRMIGAFPSNEQSQVRTMLSESLRAVISQRLVPTADGSGRVPALEVLVINKAISNLVREEKTVQIRSSIQTGKAHGMYLLEQSLNDLLAAGTITREAALALAEEKKLITAGG